MHVLVEKGGADLGCSLYCRGMGVRAAGRGILVLLPLALLLLPLAAVFLAFRSVMRALLSARTTVIFVIWLYIRIHLVCPILVLSFDWRHGTFSLANLCRLLLLYKCHPHLPANFGQ